MHLPVALVCTIQCRYCSREVGISYHSYRPAVAKEIMTPEKAVEQVLHHVDGQLRVVGIAGPGEPLCNEETFKTLSLVHEQAPDLVLCVATNGLLLYEKAGTLADLGVKTVTITVNTVNAGTVKRIYSHIEGKMDEMVARAFVQKQLKGIKACTDKGIMVKVNSLLIPGINMDELERVALESREKGASLQNITPLIPLAEFSGLRPPSCEEIRLVREKCEKILPQFRLCKQCRADAIGIPGKNDV